MKGAVWHGPENLRVEEVPDPRPEAGEVIVAVAWCGISGTDVHEYESGPIMIPVDQPHPLTGAQAPVIMGHELSGTIIEVGTGVENLRVGDRVSSNSIISCDRCRSCVAGLQNLCELTAVLGLAADGAFADYVRLPESVVFPLPDSLPMDQAALLEPISTGLHAVRRAGLEPGDQIAVIGGGPIGLGAMQSAIAIGAGETVLIEPVPERRALAEGLGARSIDPSDADALARETGRHDIVLDCADPPRTSPVGLTMLRRRGRLVILGLSLAPTELDLNKLLLGETAVLGSTGRLHREDFPALTSLILRGAIDAEVMITSRIPLEYIVPRGFEAMRQEKGAQLKILVGPSL